MFKIHVIRLKSRHIVNIVIQVIEHGLFPIFLFATVICVIVPLLPTMPGDSCHDEKWAFGLNQAVAQGFVFGRDIIFTFGPCASIYTKTYHPGTDTCMLWGALYLGITFAIAALLNFREWYLKLLFIITLAGLMYSRDALFFYYPLLVGTYVFRSKTFVSQISASGLFYHVLLIILFSSFALLLLIKGPLLVICIAVTICSFLLLAIKKDWKSAMVVCISPLISLPLFWVIMGQPLSDLSLYFKSLLSIISGYTEAMSVIGNTSEIICYIAAAASVLCGVFYKANMQKRAGENILLLLMFTTILFIAFKSGFVRHDSYHAPIPGTIIMLAGLLVISVYANKYTLIALSISFFVGIYINSNYYIKIDLKNVLNNIVLTYQSSWYGLRFRLLEHGRLAHDFKETMARIHAKSNFPIFAGTTDIYPFDQPYLISSGNIWNPRPVLHSYGAYTPQLAEKNKEHLFNKNSPNHLIFKVAAIDRRLPSLEDGASWPAIFSHYEFVQIKNDFLFLKKRLCSQKLLESLISKERHLLGESVSLPNENKPVFAKITIEQNFLGKLANLFFKSSQLEITINLENGLSRKYRIISGMAKTGFLLSPLIENTKEFAFFIKDAAVLNSKKVKSFSINSKGGSRLWNSKYEVEFLTLGLLM